MERKLICPKMNKRQEGQLSLDNAEAFLKHCKEKEYSFVPIGSAQGLSTESYIDSVNKLIEMNYKYIALGGLTPLYHSTG